MKMRYGFLAIGLLLASTAANAQSKGFADAGGKWHSAVDARQQCNSCHGSVTLSTGEVVHYAVRPDGNSIVETDPIKGTENWHPISNPGNGGGAANADHSSFGGIGGTNAGGTGPGGPQW